MTVTPENFLAKHSNMINSNLVSNNAKSKKVVILSFDNNKVADIAYANPIFDKYGFKATFFVKRVLI